MESLKNYLLDMSKYSYLPYKAYTKVNVKNDFDSFLNKFIEISKWCEENCKGSFSGYFTYWAFEFECDAIYFKLVWG